MTRSMKNLCTFAWAYRWWNILNMSICACMCFLLVGHCRRIEGALCVCKWVGNRRHCTKAWVDRDTCLSTCICGMLTCTSICSSCACIPPLAAAWAGIHDGWKEGATPTTTRNISNGVVFGSLRREVCNDGLVSQFMISEKSKLW